MTLLEKIDELRAQSVTPEQFKTVWGITIEEYLEKMMAFAAQQQKATTSKK